jgi:hypothetical protein
VSDSEQKFRVAVQRGTGHDDLDHENGVGEGAEPDIITFESAAQRAAFIKGVNLAVGALDGWEAGWITAEALD